MELTRGEFAGLIEKLMAGLDYDDERLTPAEREALAALVHARPSQRHDLIATAWGIYVERDPEARRRKARLAEAEARAAEAK